MNRRRERHLSLLATVALLGLFWARGLIEFLDDQIHDLSD